MRRVAEILLTLMALGEIAVGVALVLFPATVVWILLGAAIDGAGIVAARMAGIGAAALGLAWWADRKDLEGPRLGRVAVPFVVYNLGVGLTFLLYAWGANQPPLLAWLVGVVHSLVGVTFAVVAYRTGPDG
jgi:hypothetical protein